MNQFVRVSSAKPRKRVIALAVVCGFLLVLPSCGIPPLRRPKPGPGVPETYDPRKVDPDSDLPAAFSEATGTENSAQVKVDEFFNDPLLLNLISQALVGNQELRMMNQNVLIASNEIMSRQGAYLPFVSFGGSIGTDRPSLYTRDGAVDNQLSILPGPGFTPFPSPLANYFIGPTFFWTPDIWRQLHNAKNAAVMRYYAMAESRNYFVTRLIAEIADDYFQLIALDRRLDILDQTITLQERSLEVAKSIKEGARGTELPVQRFLAEVRRNQSEKLIVHQDIIEAENRINFLLGRNPQRVERWSGNFIDLTLHSLSIGVPPQLLQNRPDVRQAERELAATGLDVKVARKRFYPQALITSNVGFQAFDTRYLFFSPEAILANVAGNLIAPLVNKKAIRADYLSADARQLQAVYNYQRVVLNAFTEVVNRLSKVENYRNSIEVKKQQLAALDEAVQIAMRLFQFARADYVDVLFAQRDLRDARTVTVETKQQQLAAIVDTYQALGGGAYLIPIPVPTPIREPFRMFHWKRYNPNELEEREQRPLFAPPIAGGGAPGLIPAPATGTGLGAPDLMSPPSTDNKPTVPLPVPDTDKTTVPKPGDNKIPEPLPRIPGVEGDLLSPLITPGTGTGRTTDRIPIPDPM